MNTNQDWRGEHLLKISRKERASNRAEAINTVGRANGKTVTNPKTKAHHSSFIGSLTRRKK